MIILNFIGRLSSGQKRRVSLACALIHSSPLIILDEPTVGTDSVLRKNIWQHLVSLSKSGHTIIITTHYIEEARNANIVGLMRSGKILAEDNPQVLLNRYSSTKLEDVFLKLCYSESKDSNNINELSVDIEVRKQSYSNENAVNDNINSEAKSEVKDRIHKTSNQNLNDCREN